MPKILGDAERLANPPRVTGEYARSFFYKKVRAGVWRFGNNAAHAAAVEQGVRPFVYKKGATIISFPFGFRSLTRHPGSRGQNVLRDAIKKAFRNFK